MEREAIAEESPELLDDVDRLAGSACVACGRRLCGHEATCSIALGCKNAPRCLGCLARGLDQSVSELRDRLLAYLRHRPCYWRAWQEASLREGRDVERPSCMWRDEATQAVAANRQLLTEVAPVPASYAAAATWDAGQLACGELVLALRQRLQSLPQGTLLRVVANDPAAAEDVPAWCRLTGHRLVSASHPHYLIERKGG